MPDQKGWMPMINRCAWVLMTSGLVVFLCSQAFSGTTPEGTAWIDFHGYTNCIRLFNASTTVVLEPNCGGRVLEYALNGQNAIYIDPEQDGWVYTPGKPGIDPCGGRFDIGPEMTLPRHPDLWLGRWQAEITGPRSARMTSVEDRATGVRIIRDFRLDSDSSHLACTQTIENISDTVKHYYHWSRTFAEGNGIFISPLNPASRYPAKYLIFGPGPVINYDPDPHPNIAVRDGFLVVTGTPPEPQISLDPYDGWFAYITLSDLLFVKTFPMYPDRVYGDMAANTVVIWYYRDQMCELEPLGPRETIQPGGSASYTEDWRLLPYTYPGAEQVDCAGIRELVKKECGGVK